MLKYKLGFSFVTNQDIGTRNGLIPKGTQAFIEEIDESEHDGDGICTPYKVFFYDCIINIGEPLRDYEGNEIGGTDWLSENQLKEIISEREYYNEQK